MNKSGFKFAKFQGFGMKLTGFMYDELYESTVWGIFFWNYGITYVKYSKNEEEEK